MPDLVLGFERDPGSGDHEEIASPTVDDVRETMKRMEPALGSTLTLSVELEDPDYTHFGIGATTEGFIAIYQSGWNAGGANYSLVGEPHETGEVECVVAGQRVSGNQRRFFVTFERALTAAETFLETGSIDATAGWERVS